MSNYVHLDVWPAPPHKICSHGRVWKVTVLVVQEEARAEREDAAVWSTHAGSGKLKLVPRKEGVGVN